MSIVNPYFLHTLLEPLTGLADDDDAVRRYTHIDSNCEPQMRAIIRDLIVPHARTLSVAAKARVKLAYQFYLSKPGSRLERVFYSNLPPFDAPDNPRLFFVWIWEECFPGENFQLPDLGNYVENPDLHEPLQ